MGTLAVEPLKLGKGGTRRLNYKLPTSGTPINGANAGGTLGMATKPTATDTVTIGSVVYTFVATVAAEGDVAIGALVANSQENLVDMINNGDSLTDAHPDFIAADFDSDEMVISAKVAGTAKNGEATEETFTDGTDAWVAAVTSGGVAPVGNSYSIGDLLIDDTYLYVCISETVYVAGSIRTPATWKRVALGSVF